MKSLKIWKKVFENDLTSLVTEFKQAVKRPAVVTLSGDVGAGKTTFTKHFLPNQEIVSPTYSIINEQGEIAHADFYRIESAEDIMHLEIPLYLNHKQYFLIEWGKDYIQDIYREVPENFKLYDLNIEIEDDKSSRKFELSEYIL